MRPATFVVLLACFHCALSFAQQSSDSVLHDVEVCDLVRNPQAFDRQLVRFRGSLNFEFEGAEVNDSECVPTPLHTGIWWTYGGDNLPGLDPEKKTMLALVSPIQRDAQFDIFERYAVLARSLRPDNTSCHSHQECAYYQVVATFTGRFFAGKPLPWRKGVGGFGHMGCCHLFVIQQISGVNAKRTEVPRDDEPYSCTKSAWQAEYPDVPVSGWKGRGEENKDFLIEQARNRSDDVIAAAMAQDLPWRFLGLTGTITWSSRDLLLTYSAEFPRVASTGKRGKKKRIERTAGPKLVTVSKQTCQKAAQ